LFELQGRGCRAWKREKGKLKVDYSIVSFSIHSRLDTWRLKASTAAYGLNEQVANTQPSFPYQAGALGPSIGMRVEFFARLMPPTLSSPEKPP